MSKKPTIPNNQQKYENVDFNTILENLQNTNIIKDASFDKDNIIKEFINALKIEASKKNLPIILPDNKELRNKLEDIERYKVSLTKLIKKIKDLQPNMKIDLDKDIQVYKNQLENNPNFYTGDPIKFLSRHYYHEQSSIEVPMFENEVKIERLNDEFVEKLSKEIHTRHRTYLHIRVASYHEKNLNNNTGKPSSFEGLKKFYDGDAPITELLNKLLDIESRKREIRDNLNNKINQCVFNENINKNLMSKELNDLCYESIELEKLTYILCLEYELNNQIPKNKEKIKIIKEYINKK